MSSLSSSAESADAEQRAEQRTVRLSALQLRTLAHPLRARLLGSLRLDGPATATRLAASLGTNTGATSYHLRQLAEVGLVVEEVERGSGRQRWWRAAHEMSSWRPEQFDDDPDARAASDWMTGHALAAMTEEVGRWLSVAPSYPRQWQEAASFTDLLLELTPGRLRALNDELRAVFERYRAAGPGDGGSGDGGLGDGGAHGGGAYGGEARQVLVYAGAFPRAFADGAP